MEELYQQLNYPSANVLKRTLKNRGIPFDPKELQALVKKDVTRQVQAPRYAFTGKIAAKTLNARIFADLIDFTAAPSDRGKKVGLKPTDDGEKYILVVQRVFDRKLWTAALVDKQPGTVLDAFKTILNEIGEVGSLTTDGGAEFGDSLKSALQDEGVTVYTKPKTGLNDIATLDVAIGHFKKALVRVSRRRQTDDWASLLAEVTLGQNNVPKEDYLEGKAPNDVAGNVELRQKLRDKNLEFIETNREQALERSDKLTTAGRFRVMLPSGFQTRGFKPSWSDEVHTVAAINGAFVTDTDGNEYATKFTLPVEGTLEALPSTRIEQGGSVQTNAKHRRVLDEWADRVAKWLGRRSMSLGELGKWLNTQRGFKVALNEARVNMRAPIVNFLNVFPNRFTLAKNRNGAKFVTAIQGQLAFPGASRLRRVVL